MPLPTSPTWNLADFDESTIGGLLSLGAGDLTITPATTPYFSYSPDFTVLTAQSRDGATAQLDFNTSLPARFTLELLVRFPEMPHDVADLADHRAGLTVADDGGRGVSIYFSSNGLAVSRVDDFGSVLILDDSTDITEEVRTAYRTIRVAVDSGLGRAYVSVGAGDTSFPALRYIVPVEETPPSTAIDLFQLFVKGTASQPARMEIRRLRLAADLVIDNFPPTANAGPDRVAPVGQAVRFDGRSSFDVEGAPLTYRWRVTDAPFGSDYAADLSSGASTDDGDADGFTETLTFTPTTLPSWVAAGDVLRIGGALHDILTVDNAGGNLTVETDTIPDSLSATPFRILRQSLLVGADTETPYAVPDIQGIYRFELVVNDGEADSEASEVLASIVGARAPFGIEPDVGFFWDALGDEWKYIENRGVFEEAWRAAAQLLGAKLLEVWQYHYNFSIRDAQPTFQRKWIAYRTLIAETAPEDAEISVRYGGLAASHDFETANPSVTGNTLIFRYHTDETSESTADVTVAFTADDLATIISDINTALAGTGIVAYSHGVSTDSGLYRHQASDGATTDDGDADGFTETLSFTALSLPSWVAAGDKLVIANNRFTIATVNNAGGTLTVTDDALPDNLSAETFRIYRHIRLSIRSTTRAFQVLSTSTAAAALGLETDAYNYLNGGFGALITDRTYYAGEGIDLGLQGVQRGDLLVTNNGQSFRIDRVLTGPLDELDNQRVLLFENLPLDVTPEWDIPSIVRSTEVDYETEGSYPGDLVKAEVYNLDTGDTTDHLGKVIAQKEKTVGARLDGLFSAALDTSVYEIRLLGVKRRKGLPLPDDVVSIPQLQDKIPVVASPTIYKENIHYILEPFFRDVNEEPLPFLQFRDSVFIDPDTEPPDILWAELTLFDNAPNVENNFGRLVGFLDDDAATFPTDFNYVAGVAGLLYAQQRGPTVRAMRVGSQILFGQSFAEVDGIIQEIRHDFSPSQGRMLIQDDDGLDPPRTEIVRTYYYRKDPLDLSTTSGLDENPATNLPWAEGDSIPQFSPIGSGVDIVDLYNTPTWYRPFVRAGLLTEIEKFHYFLVQYNLDLVDITNLSLLFQFITKVKPTYTHPILLGLRNHIEDIDIIDEFSMGLVMHLYDSTCGSGLAYMYDDFRGDGSIWSLFDDGVSYYDAFIDCPYDVIEFCLEIAWAGGTITFDSIFFLDTDVVDVSGTLGPPGSTFTPTYDMSLPAGTYRVCGTIKAGKLVLP